ncbi:MAG: hypothetical protein AAF840_17960, partial [Bacteroidota bacterium]
KSGAQSEDTKEAAPPNPSGLEGPAYDPSTSPVPMSGSTQLPVPPGSQPAAAEPVAYGSIPLDPAQDARAKGQPTPAPEAYGNETAAPVSYGSEAAAPTAYGPAPGTAEASLAAVLSGRWVNQDDPKETVAFTPDHYTTYYNNEMLLEEDMVYHATCPGDCNEGVPMEIACFTISGPGGTDCYGIIRLTPEVLELSMLGVSTESIVYTKQK